MDKLKFDKLIEQNPFASYSDLIFDDLFDKIITLELLPGTNINSTYISNTLDISRSPVQTAINKLVEERLLIKDEHKYPYIAQITVEDCLEMTQARIFIESYAGYLAAPIIKEKYLSKLKDLSNQYENIVMQSGAVGFEKCDQEFHSCVIEASENSYLIEMYEILQSRILRYRYYLRHKLGDEKLQKTLIKSVKSHKVICHALEMGLALVVRDELTRHNDAMRDVFAKW